MLITNNHSNFGISSHPFYHVRYIGEYTASNTNDHTWSVDIEKQIKNKALTMMSLIRLIWFIFI